MAIGGQYVYDWRSWYRTASNKRMQLHILQPTLGIAYQFKKAPSNESLPEQKSQHPGAAAGIGELYYYGVGKEVNVFCQVGYSKRLSSRTILSSLSKAF